VSTSVLQVRDLTVSIGRGERRYVAVRDVSFEVPAGGSLGVVGESGSGKSLTLRALMALLPRGVRAERGVVELDGEPLPFAGPGARRARRGRLAMVFQDPLSGLDPVYTVGSQVAEVPRRVLGASAGASRARAVELLRMVGMPDPERRAHSFPHQLSGGMRQRVLIAMALASEPKVLLCDEPTTALDVTVQAQVLELLDDLRRRLGVAVVFVSHDLAVVRQVADELAVMYTGRVVETGPSNEVLRRPAHPYTLGLLEAVVDLDDMAHPPRAIPGALPDLAHVPGGCPFHPRCRFASEDCALSDPGFRYLGEGGLGRGTACKYPERVMAG
jgi:oligopeptide/dipeptide ABC transporter ATP-binding protein